MKEIIFYLLIIILSVLLLINTFSFPENLGDVGPAFFPRMLLVVLLILSVVLLINSFLKMEKQKNQDQDKDKDKKEQMIAMSLKVAFLFSLIVLYSIGMIYLGYLLSTLLFLVVAVSFMIGNIKIKTFIQKTLPTSLIITFVTYIVFKMMIHIPLPVGTLFGG